MKGSMEAGGRRLTAPFTSGQRTWARQLATFLALTLAAALGLTLLWADDSRAAFPGQDGRIFFSSDRDGNFELYSMKPDGTDQRRLSETAGDELTPAVSANGRWVAFAFIPADGSTRARLVVMRTNGTSRRDVTGNQLQADFFPSFSPDGRQLVFSRETDPAEENGRIWTIGLESGSPGRQLIEIAPARQYAPVYTPNGREIVFAQQSLIAPFGYRIYSVGNDGQGLTPISPETNASANYPTVSPRGNEVAYAASPDAVGQPSPQIDATTLGVAIPRTRTIVPPLVDLDPLNSAFSPSGSRLAFDRNNQLGEPPQINVVASDGGADTELTGPGSTNVEPAWAPQIESPRFRVVRKPPRRTKSRAAKFRFRAVTRGTRLTCKLDRKRARQCPAGRTVTFNRLKRGRHKLVVRPYLVDGTAAALGLSSKVNGKARTLRWRVR